ncbi:MAG: hypothetical protein K2K75_13615 [Muribaculaceae bacterium]|nr:hypothetical protein [Muribaculaceae bacterium]
MKQTLFEKLCQIDILQAAWMNVKSKNSAGGIDGMSVKDFGDNSEKYLSEILKNLKSGKWTPYPYYLEISQ